MGKVQTSEISFGIPAKSWNLMQQAFLQLPEIEEVWLFGSRALGNYKPGSDIDLAISGRKINWRVVTDLHAELNERLPIPYFFDVVNYHSIKEHDLIDHIKEYGQLIYRQK